MKAMESDWYKKIWTLDIQDQSWVEDTRRQVDFLVEKLQLRGDEKILDLACGFGRHSLELARRGFSVTGVDITPSYIESTREEAKREGVQADFLCRDIREIQFEDAFDVVLSMADGAIGYLENDAENLKIFTVVSKALKPGGKYFMDIMNGSYADQHFPCRRWDAGKKCLTLSAFEWDRETRVLLYGQPLTRPDIDEGNPIRLYTLAEITAILASHGMDVFSVYADFDGTVSSDQHIQLLICAEKN